MRRKEEKFKERVNHSMERKINAPWNQVLFEIKIIRDYYVDEAVLPRTVVAESNFFN
jgi:hypothetical protein